MGVDMGPRHRQPSAGDIVWFLVILLVAFILLFIFGSWAARAQEAGQVVDMRPAAIALIEWIGSAALTVATAAGGLAMRWLAWRTKLDRSRLEEEYNRRIGDLIHRGIEFAITSAKTEVAKPDSPINKVVLDNWFLAQAASYVNQRAPELLGYFTVRPEALQEMILARMPAYFGEVAVAGGASPTITTSRVGEQMGVQAAPAVGGQPAPVVLPPASDTSGSTG
jgi:hypothetical protein